MKTTDKKALLTKSTKELQKSLEDRYNDLAQLQIDHVQNKLKNTRTIFHTRKEIAIMKTVLSMQLKTKEEKESATALKK